MFCIQQIGEYDCGFTALKVLFANTFNKEDYLYLCEDENHGPFSLLELIDIAKNYGLILKGVKFEAPEYDPLPSKPFLAVFKEGENVSHLIYVHKINKNNVEIFDPKKGKKVMKKKEFFTLFDGTALIIDKVEGEVEIEPKINDLPKKRKVFLSFIQVFSLIFLILGMMFIDKESYIFIPIICFTVYIILQILLEKYITTSMKQIDFIYLGLLENRVESTKELLRRLSEYKKSLFIGPIKLVSDIITSIFLSVVMLINNYYSSIIVATILVVVLFDLFFMRGFIEKKEEAIAVKEQELEADPDDPEYNFKAVNLYENVYNVTMIKRSLRYITIFLIFLSAFITMTISMVVSVPFILIHIIFGITIYDCLLNISNYEKDIELRKVNFMKLVNIIKGGYHNL